MSINRLPAFRSFALLPVIICLLPSPPAGAAAQPPARVPEEADIVHTFGGSPCKRADNRSLPFKNVLYFFIGDFASYGFPSTKER